MFSLNPCHVTTALLQREPVSVVPACCFFFFFICTYYLAPCRSWVPCTIVFSLIFTGSISRVSNSVDFGHIDIKAPFDVFPAIFREFSQIFTHLFISKLSTYLSRKTISNRNWWAFLRFPGSPWTSSFSLFKFYSHNRARVLERAQAPSLWNLTGWKSYY